MEWTEQGVILGTRRHGEASAVVEVFTRGRGRHLGLVRGGRSKRLQVLLQPGNVVTATWRARLEDHLGNYAVELDEGLAAMLMESAPALYGFAAASAYVRLLPERDPHEGLYEAFRRLMRDLADPMAGATGLARFELMVLADLGFGLDLASCAATGRTDDLVWVSPRTGRAVGREAGAPYAERLLPLPGFLLAPAGELPSVGDLRAAYRLTGYFLERHVFEPRGLSLPPERPRILRALSGPSAD